MKLKRALASVATITSMLAMLLLGATPAQASDNLPPDTAENCSTAVGGYVCVNVSTKGTWIDHVHAIRGKLLAGRPFQICRSSAWAYYIPPSGGAYTLAYEEYDPCVYLRANYILRIHRSIPSGSRICVEFKEFGTPVGGEPCVTVR